MTENTQRESHLRSILKTFSWRIIATATTIIAALIITGEIGDALKIGAVEFVAKLFIYYGHERLWQQVPPGTIRKFFKR